MHFFSLILALTKLISVDLHSAVDSLVDVCTHTHTHTLRLKGLIDTMCQSVYSQLP